MSDILVKINCLNKTFADTSILKDVNLFIKKFSITGIIGKSGAGKTTLLRCLNLLEKPDTGQIIIDGQNIISFDSANLRKIRQKIGVVFQSFNLISNKTVAKNISLPLECIGMAKNKIDEKVKHIADLIGLKEKLSVYPSCLSGGQKQRVAIARSLISDVDILLCDEFTSALDPETTLEILELLYQINTTLKVTIIIITHDMTVIREICDYVYVMDKGQIVENGQTFEIFYNPQHEVTRALVSSVLVREIPNSYKTRLTDIPISSNEVLVSLIFSNYSSHKSLVSAVIREFNISINIISGHLDHVRDSTLGNLLISFQYDLVLYPKIVQFLKQHGVNIELLGYLRERVC